MKLTYDGGRGRGTELGPCLFKCVMQCFVHCQNWNGTIDDLQNYPHPDWYIPPKEIYHVLNSCPDVLGAAVDK